MGDKQISQPQLLLEFLQQVDDLGLNGNIQGGDRLVTNHQRRLAGQSSRHSQDAAAVRR